jgi:hypothetical protein
MTLPDDEERRIDIWVSVDAAQALTRLARHRGITKRMLLENMLSEADRAVQRTIDPGSEDWGEYFSGR